MFLLDRQNPALDRLAFKEFEVCRSPQISSDVCRFIYYLTIGGELFPDSELINAIHLIGFTRRLFPCFHYFCCLLIIAGTKVLNFAEIQ